MTLEATGSNLIVGFKENLNTWGSGEPVVVGAGDGVEVDSESISLDAGLIEHTGLSGQGTMLPAILGEKLTAGDLVCPVYYRGLEVAIAQAMGTAATPAQQGGTAAYAHAYTMAATTEGKVGTLVMGGANHPAVREIPFAKIGGFTFDIARNAEAKVTFPVVGFDAYLNADTPTTVGLVASIEPADTTHTIVGQPLNPSRVTLLITDGDVSITEYIVTITGTDDEGNYAVEAYTLSTDTLAWISTTRWSAITSVIGTGLAGTTAGDTLIMGYEYGINNVSNYTSIGIPTTADYQLASFDQFSVWMNEQSGGALTTTEGSADEVYPDSIRISLNRSLSQNVTTRFGRQIDEPHGTNFAAVEVGLNFPNWNTESQAVLRDRLQGKQFKVFVKASGPLADTGFALEWSFWANAVQFGSGSPNAGGPGDMRFDATGTAHRVLTAATGRPAWADNQPLSLYNINLRTTKAIT